MDPVGYCMIWIIGILLTSIGHQLMSRRWGIAHGKEWLEVLPIIWLKCYGEGTNSRDGWKGCEWYQFVIVVNSPSHLHDRYHYMITFEVWWKVRINLNHGNCHSFSILNHDCKEPMTCGMNFLWQLAVLVLYPKQTQFCGEYSQVIH